MKGLFCKIFEIEGRQVLARAAPDVERDNEISLTFSMWFDEFGSVELKLAFEAGASCSPADLMERTTEAQARLAFDQLTAFQGRFA